MRGSGCPGSRRALHAVYHDQVQSGDESESAETIFSGETIEYYVYDQNWRITSVWRAGPATGSPAARPNARCYERFTYSNAGLNGRGDAWLLDCPVLSEIDEDGDGAFERLRRYLQNARGDVVGVEESNPWYDREAVRYSVFGFPEVFQNEDPYHTADFNGDGNPGTDADITAFFQVLAGYPCSTCGSADTNRDGAVGTDDDITAFFAAIAGTGPATYPVSLSDNRFGFRGYWWDDHLKLYHVRNRVYDPASFRWLQPDPAGYVDGLNLYAYCGGDPVNLIDPYGLYGLKDWVRDSYSLFTGHVTNNMVNGTAGAIHGAAKAVVTTAAVVVIVATLPVSGTVIAVVSVPLAAYGAYETGHAIAEAAYGEEFDQFGNPTGRELTAEERGERGGEAAVGIITIVVTPMVAKGAAGEVGEAGEAGEGAVGNPADMAPAPNGAAVEEGSVGSLEDWTDVDAEGRIAARDAAWENDNVINIHGNSANSPRTAYLYRLYTLGGEFLKNGVSQNPATRYTKSFMADKYMQIVAKGPRKAMLKLERAMTEEDPGPLNCEKWAGSRSGQ